MVDLIVIAVLALVIGGAVAYIVKSKKKGGCIGCPNGGNCSTCRIYFAIGICKSPYSSNSSPTIPKNR